MRYFHRTSLPPDQVLAASDRFFGDRLTSTGREHRGRAFTGAVGQVTVTVRAEAGHYTLITVETDQVGESELDKLAKRFLAVVHQQTEPKHALRGAY